MHWQGHQSLNGASTSGDEMTFSIVAWIRRMRKEPSGVSPSPPSSWRRLDRPLGSRRCRGRRDTSVGQRFVWAPRLGVALVRLQCRGGRGESRGADQEREHRQFGVVDGEGRSATYTGTECLPWAGGIVGDGFSCQGNVVAGPGVVDAMAEVFAGPGDLGARLLAALHAGDRAGGDRRGDNRRRFWWFAMVVGTSAART